MMGFVFGKKKLFFSKFDTAKTLFIHHFINAGSSPNRWKDKEKRECFLIRATIDTSESLKKSGVNPSGWG